MSEVLQCATRVAIVSGLASTPPPHPRNLQLIAARGLAETGGQARSAGFPALITSNARHPFCAQGCGKLG
eukprot:6207941-Alexandrium_andersonii.AAC.1